MQLGFLRDSWSMTNEAPLRGLDIAYDPMSDRFGGSSVLLVF